LHNIYYINKKIVPKINTNTQIHAHFHKICLRDKKSTRPKSSAHQSYKNYRVIIVPALPSKAKTASSSEQMIASLPVLAKAIAASILISIEPSGNCPSFTYCSASSTEMPSNFASFSLQKLMYSLDTSVNIMNTSASVCSDSLSPERSLSITAST